MHLVISEELVGQPDGSDARRLRLVASPEASTGSLSAALVEMSATQPDCELTVVERPDDEARAAIRRREADLAVVCRAETDSAPWRGLAGRVLACDRLMLAVPARHPASRDARRVELAGLAEERWVLPSPGRLNHTLALAACRAAGFEPVAPYHTDDAAFALELVAAGLGVAVLPPVALVGAGDAVVPLPIRDAPLRLTMALWHRDRCPDAVCAMLGCLGAQAIGNDW